MRSAKHQLLPYHLLVAEGTKGAASFVARDSQPLAQLHPRSTVCVRKHDFRRTTRAAFRLATDCADSSAQAFGALYPLSDHLVTRGSVEFNRATVD